MYNLLRGLITGKNYNANRLRLHVCYTMFTRLGPIITCIMYDTVYVESHCKYIYIYIYTICDMTYITINYNIQGYV